MRTLGCQGGQRGQVPAGAESVCLRRGRGRLGGASPLLPPRGAAKKKLGVAPKCVRACLCVWRRGRASGDAQGLEGRRGPFKEPEGAGPGRVAAGGEPGAGRPSHRLPGSRPAPSSPSRRRRRRRRHRRHRRHRRRGRRGARSRGQAGPHRSPASARAPPEPCALRPRPALRDARQLAGRGPRAGALGGGGGRIASRPEAGPAARPQPDRHRHLPERPGGPSAPQARAPPLPPPRGLPESLRTQPCWRQFLVGPESKDQCP
ncbi:serine/arginine repetitive matrix protein 3-like [Trachypithecus francoisi]|uniref:serine/arginine repetitive matrix protein 3-like n=1 Tax=Trachypithecus francoisi TaxID=54180 RepID=UPI00141B3473|nr:serine/arginine repetitive matrix protein 3-like [Trachypithecus francoisi]